MKDKVIYVDFKSKIATSKNSAVNIFFKSIFSKIRNLFKVTHCYTDSKVISFKRDQIS